MIENAVVEFLRAYDKGTRKDEVEALRKLRTAAALAFSKKESRAASTS